MQSPSVAFPLAALLLCADSLPHCTGLLYRPAMLKTSQILAPTKYRRSPKIHWFSPNYSSLYICSQASYQKLVKTKSDHHHCPISVHILITSKTEAITEIQRLGLWLFQWEGTHVEGGGRRGGGDALMFLSGQGEGGVWVNSFPSAPGPGFHLPPTTLSFNLSFAYLLAAVRPSLDKILDRDDPNK
jgi:hypothetical protein